MSCVTKSTVVRCARANALLNDLEHRAEFRVGDLFAPVLTLRQELPSFLLWRVDPYITELARSLSQ